MCSYCTATHRERKPDMLSHLDELGSEEEVKQQILQALSSFGGVASINIFKSSKDNPHRIALATMNSPELAHQAASAYGLHAFGYKSLIIPIHTQHH